MCYNRNKKSTGEISMDLIFNIGQSFLIGLAALFIIRWGSRHNIGILRIQGRINRLQFLIGLLVLFTISGVFTSFTKTLMSNVVILAGYWGIRLLIIVGHILIMPFYYVLYVRRLHDLSIPGIFGVLWSIFIVFTYSYTSVKSVVMLLAVLMLLINLILLCVPGSSNPNRYGPPSLWPKKRRKRRRPMDPME